VYIFLAWNSWCLAKQKNLKDTHLFAKKKINSMPCIILTGHPSVGKTTLANHIKEQALKHPSQRIQSVIIVNESTACPGLTQAKCYLNSHNEKKTRAALKACFDHATQQQQQKAKSTLVILDSLNYIKGYRYELHCISKAAGEQHCVIWVMNDPETAKCWNRERNRQALKQKQRHSSSSVNDEEHLPFYSDRTMEELMQRYEPPDERNRWDKPLYKVNMRPMELKKQQQQQQQTQANTEAGGRGGGEGEILEKSVYNMHALSDVMGTKSSTSQTKELAPDTGENGDTVSNNAHNDATTAKPKKSFKGFKRACKVTNKTVKPTMISPNANVSASTDLSQADLLNTGREAAVLYPKVFLYSSGPANRNEPLQSFQFQDNIKINRSDITSDDDENGTSHQDNRPHPNHTPRRHKNNKSPSLHPPQPDPASSVEDQVNAILDNFLLHVRPLTEGTSTQQPVVAGSANVLHEMDAVTQSACDAIIHGQTLGTGTSGNIPVVLTLEGATTTTTAAATATATATSAAMTQSSGINNPLFLKTNRYISPAELQRLRRQYLRWVATHPLDDCDTEYGIAKSFLTYIEAQL